MAGKSPEGDISRRAFIHHAATLTTAASLAPLYAPVLPAYVETAQDLEASLFEPVAQRLRVFMEPTEKSVDTAALAQRLQEWTFPNGTKAASVIPGLQETVDALRAPQAAAYMPFPTPPVEVKKIKDYYAMGSLHTTAEVKNTDYSMQLKTPTNPQGIAYKGLSSFQQTIELDTQFQGAAELAILMKEAAQIPDYVECARVAASLFSKQGMEFELNNITITPANESYMYVWAATNTLLGQQAIKRTSVFVQFTDAVGHMRTGGIAYENWRLNYPREHGLVPKRFHEIGQKVVGILKDADLLEQKGTLVTWKYGQPPAIASDTMMQLVTAYTGVPFSSF